MALAAVSSACLSGAGSPAPVLAAGPSACWDDSVLAAQLPPPGPAACAGPERGGAGQCVEPLGLLQDRRRRGGRAAWRGQRHGGRGVGARAHVESVAAGPASLNTVNASCALGSLAENLNCPKSLLERKQRCTDELLSPVLLGSCQNQLIFSPISGWTLRLSPSLNTHTPGSSTVPPSWHKPRPGTAAPLLIGWCSEQRR